MKTRGFTLIEVLLAMLLLAGGASVLWLSLRHGFTFEQRQRARQIAWEALLSEAERLQGRSQALVHDSLYALPAEAGRKIEIKRIVLDSTRRDALFDPMLLTPRVSQILQSRPLEVRLQAWIEMGNAEDANASADVEDDETAHSSYDTLNLFFVLPDYQWY